MFIFCFIYQNTVDTIIPYNPKKTNTAIFELIISLSDKLDTKPTEVANTNAKAVKHIVTIPWAALINISQININQFFNILILLIFLAISAISFSKVLYISYKNKPTISVIKNII